MRKERAQIEALQRDVERLTQQINELQSQMAWLGEDNGVLDRISIRLSALEADAGIVSIEKT